MKVEEMKVVVHCNKKNADFVVDVEEIINRLPVQGKEIIICPHCHRGAFEVYKSRDPQWSYAKPLKKHHKVGQ